MKRITSLFMLLLVVCLLVAPVAAQDDPLGSLPGVLSVAEQPERGLLGIAFDGAQVDPHTVLEAVGQLDLSAYKRIVLVAGLDGTLSNVTTIPVSVLGNADVLERLLE